MGRHLLRTSRPTSAERKSELLRFLVARASEGVDLPSLPSADLSENMSGRAETVEANPAAIAGQSKGTPADQSCTHQRRRADGVLKAGEGKSEGGIRYDMGRKTAIARISGEDRVVAEVLSVRRAIGTLSACMPEPGDADARAKRRRRAASKRVYDANNFMAGNNGELWIGQITIHYM